MTMYSTGSAGVTLPDWDYPLWETDVPLIIQNAVLRSPSTPSVALNGVSDSMNFSVPASNWEVPDITVADIPFNMDPPELEPVPAIVFDYDKPDLEAFRQLNPIDIALSVDWPSFVGTAPVLDFSGEPGPLTATDPGAAPNIDDVPIPEAPSYVLPDAPTIEDLVLPQAPEVFIPEFDRELVLNDIPDTKAMDFIYAAYNSEVGPVLASKLIGRLIAGGTGLSQETEEAIFGRHLYRREQASEQAFADMLGFFESRGFSLPTGIMQAKADELTRAKLRETADIADSIMIEQAKLAKEDEQFIMKSGMDFEAMCRDFFIKETGIRLEASKAVSENSIALLQAAIASNNALIAAYQAYAQVQETKIRTAMAKIELFKAQLEAVKTQADIQELKVKIYSVLLQGVLAQIEVYKGRMQAASLLMEIQKTKMDVFGKRVEVYTAQTQAWATQWSAYRAKIEGQIARVQAFSAEASAFATQVTAIKTRVEGYVAEKQIELQINEQTLKENTLKLEKLKAELQEALGSAELDIKYDTLLMQGYETKMRGITAVYDAKYKMAGALIEQAKSKAGIAMEVSKLRTNIALGNLSVAGEVTKSVIAGTATIRAAIAGQTHVSGTASNSLATGVQMQAGYQKSFSQSQSKQASWSRSQSKSDSTITQETTTNQGDTFSF